MRVFIAAVLVGASLQPFACRASAQSVLVQITEAETGLPITGAFVSLLNGQGKALRSALTNDGGRFLFRAPDSGSFQVKAEMIGRETRLSPSFTLGIGQAGQISLTLPVYAIPLRELRIEADKRCRLRPDEASVISRVWAEARKALTLQAWTEQEGLYQFEIVGYERDLDRRGKEVEKEERRKSTAITDTPIGSLPVEDLLANGFIQPLEDGGYQYYGPDARVLLSDPFLDTHCLRLTRSRKNPGSIGLAFEPARKSEIPDVRGTLWLDEGTANLDFLEYDYTWAPHKKAKGIGRGRVEFAALPNGAWIVDRWWIRAPILGQDEVLFRLGHSGGIFLAGIRETGGSVAGVSTLAPETLLLATCSVEEREKGASVLTGFVRDTRSGKAIPGASVRFDWREIPATNPSMDATSGWLEVSTDGEGRYTACGVPLGTPILVHASFLEIRSDTIRLRSVEERYRVLDLGIELPPGLLSSRTGGRVLEE